MPTSLDETIALSQAGHIADHQVIATEVNRESNVTDHITRTDADTIKSTDEIVIERGTVAGASVGHLQLKNTDGNIGFVGIQGGNWFGIGIWAPGVVVTTTPTVRVANGGIAVNRALISDASSITLAGRGDIGTNPGTLVTSGGTVPPTFAIKKFAAQTGAMQEWRDENNTVMASFKPDGGMWFGNPSVNDVRIGQISTNVAGTNVRWWIGGGTDGAPELASSSDQNTGIRWLGSDILAINTNSAQRVLVDASGHVTINSGRIKSGTAGGWALGANNTWGSLSMVNEAGTTQFQILEAGYLGLNYAPNLPIRIHTAAGTERLRIGADIDIGVTGKLVWGTAFGTNDTNLYRSAATTLKTDGNFYAGAGLAVGPVTLLGGNGELIIGVGPTDRFRLVPTAGDQWFQTDDRWNLGPIASTNVRLSVKTDGKVWFGDGASSTRDTNLYRSAADTLKTDDAFFGAGAGNNRFQPPAATTNPTMILNSGRDGGDLSANQNVMELRTRNDSATLGGMDYLGRWFVNPGNFASFTPATIDASVMIGTRGTAPIGVIIRGANGQTGALQQWQNDSGGVLSFIDAAGRPHVPVVATGSLPAAATAMDGAIIIEDAGAGDRNLIIYAGAQRFRIDGGTAF